jgi:hypothetical protein
LFARDADALARSVKVPVTVTRSAQVAFQVFDDAGNLIRTARALTASGPATLSFTWDGKADGGSWAPDGWYRSVVTATTSLGSYSQERRFYAGAFRISPSIGSAVRGGRLTLTIKSTEPLSRAPVVQLTQPGLTTWKATATHVIRNKYKLTITLRSGGDAGTLRVVVAGTDKDGGSQQTGLSLPLR